MQLKCARVVSVLLALQVAAFAIPASAEQVTCSDVRGAVNALQFFLGEASAHAARAGVEAEGLSAGADAALQRVEDDASAADVAIKSGYAALGQLTASQFSNSSVQSAANTLAREGETDLRATLTYKILVLTFARSSTGKQNTIAITRMPTFSGKALTFASYTRPDFSIAYPRTTHQPKLASIDALNSLFAQATTQGQMSTTQIQATLVTYAPKIRALPDSLKAASASWTAACERVSAGTIQ